MSRDTENLQSTQHEGAPATAGDVDVEAEHRPDVARRASLAGLRREAAALQRKTDGSAAPANQAVHAAAARGIASPTTALPHAAQIQASFGADHDVSGIHAHVGGNAAAAMGATAFASGDHVVFDRSPDLHTAAHEAAHVVQQTQGVNLYGGVGEAGDAHERHADAVADRVVAGQSAADLLGAPTTSAGPGAGAVQRKPAPEPKISDASVDQRRDQHARANVTGAKAILTTLRFATKELYTLASQIEKVIETPPNEAGMDRQLRSVEELFTVGRDAVHRLSIELGLAHKGEVPEDDELKRELFTFYDGFTAFEAAITKAKNYAIKDPREHLNANTTPADDEIKEMFHTRGWNPRDSPPRMATSGEHGHAAPEARKEPTDHLLAQALDANTEATIQTAHLVRMRMTSAADEQFGHDTARLVSHVSELASLLEHADNRSVKLHKPAIAKALHELHSLENEIAGRPQAATRFGSGSMFSEALRKIRAKLGR